MNDDVSTSEIPHYPVTLLEVGLIVTGAIALTAIALGNLWIQAQTEAADPIRAELIAHSLIDYKIPGGSQGVVGVNIGATKFAIVQSLSDPPDVLLLVNKYPTTSSTTNRAAVLSFDVALEDRVNGEFMPSESRTETKEFCGKMVPVRVEQGKQTFNSNLSMPAVLYVASVVQDKTERTVLLLTLGKDAEAKAATVFNSLQCH